LEASQAGGIASAGTIGSVLQVITKLGETFVGAVSGATLSSVVFSPTFTTTLDVVGYAVNAILDYHRSRKNGVGA
jgi:hypothetical protein